MKLSCHLVQFPAREDKAYFSSSFKTLCTLLDVLLCSYFSPKGLSLVFICRAGITEGTLHVTIHSISLLTLGDSPTQRNR